MTLERFQQMIATGKPLAGEEMITFMREQSDATRRLLFDLNGSYHSPEEIVALFSRITDNKVDDSFRLFPPFYTDFGKNIHLGKNVFINSCCQFQDQGGIFIGDGALIGHSVVMATLNRCFAPRRPSEPLSFAHPYRKRCMDRRTCHHLGGRDHWRPRYRSGRCGGKQGRSCTCHSRRSTG